MDSNTALKNLIQRINEEHQVAYHKSFKAHNSDYWLGRLAIAKELLNFFDKNHPHKSQHDLTSNIFRK
ncbi:hypothetical protein ABE096_04140 [Robertmurraya massiliosenegalensis]|uniref:hypothetical protein n=1 Tax=Robertmurraya TaxID=2837507 RepID=UPI0039A736DE